MSVENINRLDDLPIRHDPVPAGYRTADEVVTKLIIKYHSVTGVLVRGGPLTIGEPGPWLLRYRANRRVLRELLEEFGQIRVVREIDEVAKRELAEHHWRQKDLLDDEIKTSFF